jgi:hypothetical protein
MEAKMANRSDCKSFVRAEPIFHSKFCIKTHPHHTKLLCSWGRGGTGGGAGGGGGGGGPSFGYAATGGGAGVSMGGAGGGGVGFSTGQTREQFLADVKKFNPMPDTHGMGGGGGGGHEHMPPVRGAPGPIAGTGVAGLIVALILVVLYRRRKARA